MGPGKRPSPDRNRGKFETILNQPIPASRRNFERAAWAIVLLMLIHLCWLQSRPESGLRQIWSLATAPAAGRPAVVQYEQIDRIASQVTNSNVLLKLVGYAKTNPAVEYHLGLFHYWTSYALYPHRLYAAPENTVINNVRDIMRAAFNPGPGWLQEHDVRYVLTYGTDRAGEKTPQLSILQFPDDPTGTQTNRAGGN